MGLARESYLKRIIVLVLAAIAMAGLIAWAWKIAGVPTIPDPAVWDVFPKPGVWRKFFSLAFPLLFLFFSIWRLWAQRDGEQNRDHAISYRRWDVATYIALVFILIIIFFWKQINDWYLWLVSLYVGLVIIKTGVAAGFEVRKWQYSLISHSVYNSSGLFWIPALGLGLLGALIAFSFPATGDEPHYLLLSHSIIYDGDLNLSNNIAHKDYLGFCWIGFSPHYLAIYPNGDAYSIGYNGLFPFILAPGYALMGRLGTILIVAFISAWMVRESSLLALDITKSPRAAWITWLLVGFTPPVIYFSHQVYPEVSAGLLMLLFLRRWIRKDPHLIGWGIAIMLALVALKIRFGMLSAGILLLLLFRMKTLFGRILSVVCAAVFVAALFWTDRHILDGLLIYRQSLITGPILPQLIPTAMTARAIVAFLFDQEFGLFLYSPLYIAGLVGLLWFGRQYPKPLIAFLVVSGGYIYLLVTYQAPLWFAGWSTPSRYICGMLPLLGIIAGTTISICKRSVTQLIGTIAAIIIGIQVWILTIKPLYRYNPSTGVSNLLEKIYEATGADIARFFPSLVNPTFEGSLVIVVLALAIIAGAVVLLFRNPHLEALTEMLPASALRRNVLIGIIITVFLSLTLIGMGRILPVRVIQGEAMQGSGGIHFADNRINVYVMKKGALLSREVVVKSGLSEFKIFAGGLSTDEELPVLSFYIDGVRVSRIPIISGKNDWVKGTYGFFVTNPNRRVHIRVVLENGEEGKGIFRGAYVDRIEICPDRCGI